MEKYCFSCMSSSEGDIICPNCGERYDIRQDFPLLPFNYTLDNKYQIGRCIESRGDGFTYIGNDIARNQKVYIREFYPHSLVDRAQDFSVIFKPEYKDELEEYQADFQDMAKKLMKLNDQTALMPVYDIVWANNTVYYVTEYIENVTLAEAVDAARGKGIAWSSVKNLFDEFLSGIAVMHRLGIVHRGITPDTLRLCSDGKLRLVGFSIPAARMAGRGIQPNLEEGFSAPEQLKGTPYPDSSSDIYGICATIYYTLTGTKYQIEQQDDTLYPADLPQYVPKVLKKGMRSDPEQRFINAEELKAALNDERIVLGNHVMAANLADKLEGYELGDETPMNEKKHKSKLKVVMITASLGILVLAVVVIVALYVFLDVNIFTAGLYQVSSQTTSVYSSIETESTTSTGVITVPDLIGLNIKDAYEQIDTDKFTVQIKMSAFNDSYARNYIMFQSPEAGSPAPGKTTLVLTVSRGPEYVVMPQLEGLSIEEAAQKLNDLGLEMVLMVMPDTNSIDTNNDGIPDEVRYQKDLDGDGIIDVDQKVETGVILQSQYQKNAIVKAESAILLYAVPRLSDNTASSAPSGTADEDDVTSSQLTISWATDTSAYADLITAMNSSSASSSASSLY